MLSGTETGEEDLKLLRCSSPCSVYDLADAFDYLLSAIGYLPAPMAQNGPASTRTRDLPLIRGML